jgi:hypothetical protein
MNIPEKRITTTISVTQKPCKNGKYIHNHLIIYDSGVRFIGSGAWHTILSQNGDSFGFSAYVFLRSGPWGNTLSFHPD